MENGEARRSEQLGLLPSEGIDWSRVEAIRRVWLEDVGGDQGARLDFMADQGLRLIMADLGPAGGETLHFYNPRDSETLHMRAGGGEGLLSESRKYFPSASRWIELLRGGGEVDGRCSDDMHTASGLLVRGGSLLEVEAGRVRKVFEAWRDYPQVLLYGARAGEAAAMLESGYGTDGTAMAVAFLQAVEDARGMKVPVAALAMRVTILEAARVLGQLAWLRTAASRLGRMRTEAKYTALHREFEKCIEEWLGEPMGRGWLVPGGVREGFPIDGAGELAAKLDDVAEKWGEISLRAPSLPVPGWMQRKLRRLEGEVEKNGWVGPLGRAAGSRVDVRKEEPAVYEASGWESGGALESGGLLRRMLSIRAADVTSSLAVMQRILEFPPDAPLLVKRGRGGRGEGFGRCEGLEGETCCHVALEKGRISFVFFSLPGEVNRSAARILEGCRLDEVEAISLLWETPPAEVSG